MPSADAIVTDVAAYLRSHRLQSRFGSDTLRPGDVVNLLQHLCCDDSSTTTAATCKQIVRDIFGGGQPRIARLHLLLNACCGVQPQLTEADIRRLWTSIAGDPELSAALTSHLAMELVSVAGDSQADSCADSCAASDTSDTGAHDDDGALVASGSEPRPVSVPGGTLQLQLVLAQKQESLAKLQVEFQAVTKSRNYYKAMCSTLREQLVDSRAETASLVRLTNFRPGKRNISTYGGYAVALGRNLGHASAETAIAMIAGQPHQGGFVTGKTTVAFEHKACAVLRVQSKLFYEELASEVVPAALADADSCVEVFR